MGAETAYIFLIVYMFYMLHVVHDLRSRLTELQSQFTNDRELIVVNFIDSLDTGDLNSAAEFYQKLSGCTPENAKAFIERVRRKAEDLTSEPTRS